MRVSALTRAMLVPPELRALARVVSDIDYTQFPELYPPGGRGDPPEAELENLLADITGSPLSAREMRHFRAVFMEVRHHLRGVDAETMAESQVGGALALTSRIDATCTEADVPLAHVFPNIKAAHNFFLDIMSFKFSVEQAPVFYRLSDAICALLLRALEELQRYKDKLADDASGNGPGSGGGGRKRKITVDSSIRNTDGGTSVTETVTSGCTHASVAAGGDDDNFEPWRRDDVVLPDDFECIFADVDGDVGIHITHLRWYVEVSRESIFFDSAAYLDDNSARKLWYSYIGKDVPACFAEFFAPVLQIFPEWSHSPIMDVLDYKRCGVVSLFTLRRLLSLWGPFLLLDRNMQDDMRSGLFDLSHSLEYHKKAFARRPDAEEGDCVLMLSEAPGEAVALVLRSSPNAQGGPLALRTVSFTQHTGAWMAEGLTAEEFDAIYDACRAFPDLFRRPCGTAYAMPAEDAVATETNAGDEHNADAPTASSLHRACFRNNERYVRTLLGRGSSVVVNVAVSDPVISSRFSWTALMCSVNNPNSDPEVVVQLLLDAGADVHIFDDALCSALYYAIANGYAGAARVLLEHCPTLRTSNSSVTLLVALGAHHFHTRESDIRRLADLIPSADMLEVLLRYETNLRLVRLAVDIIEGKLQDNERIPCDGDNPSIFRPDGETELRTPEDCVYLANIISYHSCLCRRFHEEVSRAARVLYHHCYYLSCQEHFQMKQLCSEKVCMASS